MWKLSPTVSIFLLPCFKLIYKIKGADRTALITDAMRAAGMPPGESILGSLHNGLKVIVEDEVAKLPDRSSFAGSVATADRLVRTYGFYGWNSITGCRQNDHQHTGKDIGSVR